MTVLEDWERCELEFLKAKCEGLKAQLKAQPKALRARKKAEVECLQNALEASYEVQAEQEARIKMVEANNITIKKHVGDAKREGEERLRDTQNSFQQKIDEGKTQIRRMQEIIDGKAQVLSHRATEIEQLKEAEENSKKIVQDIVALTKNLRSRSKDDGGITTDVAEILTCVCKILGVSESDVVSEKEDK